jgi:hypothetical protein
MRLFNTVISYSMWDCNCQGGGLVPHRIEAKEDLDTNQVLQMTVKCLTCSKEAHFDFNNEEV